MANILIEETIIQEWADTVREKTGMEDRMKPSVLLKKMQEAWNDGSVGTLAVKSGTVDVSGGYTFEVVHKCGKLPEFVLVEVPNETTPSINKITFAFWQNEYASFTVRASTTELLANLQMQYHENILPSANMNAVMVDEEKILVKSTQVFSDATFKWYAIYGVDDNSSDDSSALKLATTIRFYDLNVFNKPDVVLELPNLAEVTNMFYQLVANETVESIEVRSEQSPEIMQHVFSAQNSASYDYKLKKITINFDTSKAERWSTTFNRLYALEIIDGMPLDFSGTGSTEHNSVFNELLVLKEMRWAKESQYKSISISKSPLLSDDTVQSIVDGLADLTGQTSQTLTLHADVKAKLTDAQIATITDKNWTLA